MINNLFNQNGIYYVNIASSLNKFDRIMNIYNLQKYTKNKINEPCLFFGMYDYNDVSKILNHKGVRYLIWGGTDADTRIDRSKDILLYISSIPNIVHLAISKNLQNRLEKFNIKSININFNLVDNQLFKPITNYGNYIYIYDGGEKNSNKFIYDIDTCEKIIKILSHIKFIRSSEINISYEKMPEIYKQCFIGIRLCKNDGNANTVQELLSMNIPVIYNGDIDGCIKYENINDIVKTINYTIKKYNIII